MPLVWLACSVFVAAHALWAVAQIESVAEVPLPQALDAPVVRAVLVDRRFAVLWWTRVLLGLVLGARMAAAARSGLPRGSGARWTDVGLGVALVLAVALGGHASGARELPPLALGVDALHLAAAAVWLGGLAQLAALLPASVRAGPEPRASILRELVPRVSKVGLGGVAVLVATGTFSAWEQAGTVEAVLTTAYGQTLLLKIAVLIPLLGIAAVNRFVLRPRLVAAVNLERLTRRFGSLVAGELLLGGAVLLFAAMLGSLPPPGPQGLPGPLEVARRAGDPRVQLSVNPNWVGVSRFRVFVTDAQGQPVPDIRDVILTFTMEGMNMGRTTVPAAATQPRVFEAEGFYLGMPGVAQIGVAVSRTAGADEGAVFRIETPNVSERQFQGLGPTLAGPATNERPASADPDGLAQGEGIYVQHCAVCHGDTGIGNGPAAASLLPPPADLTLHARWHADEQVFWFITHGVPGTPMPSFADQLRPGERWAVIAHLHALAAAPTATSPREAPVGPAQVAEVPPAPPRDELIGRVVFAPDTDRDFWIWRFPAESPERLAPFTRLDFASFPTWSPDGQRLVFSFYRLPRVGAIPAGTDLYLMNADGSDVHPLAMHDTPGAALLYPAWASDGSGVYVTHQARRPGGGAEIRIERVDARSRERETVVANAAYPGPAHHAMADGWPTSRCRIPTAPARACGSAPRTAASRARSCPPACSCVSPACALRRTASGCCSPPSDRGRPTPTDRPSARPAAPARPSARRRRRARRWRGMGPVDDRTGRAQPAPSDEPGGGPAGRELVPDRRLRRVPRRRQRPHGRDGAGRGGRRREQPATADDTARSPWRRLVTSAVSRPGLVAQLARVVGKCDAGVPGSVTRVTPA